MKSDQGAQRPFQLNIVKTSYDSIIEPDSYHESESGIHLIVDVN